MLTAIQEAIRNFARDSFGSGGEEPFEKTDFADRLLPGQKDQLDDLLPEIHELIRHATTAKKELRIYLIGHTDSQGNENSNLALIVKRAAHISSLLAASGIDQDLIRSAGVGAMKPLRTEPLRTENDEAGRSFNRSVTFEISLKVPPHNERSQ